MQFRWVAVITLYTFLIGPIFDRPGLSANTGKQNQGAARTEVRPLSVARP